VLSWYGSCTDFFQFSFAPEVTSYSFRADVSCVASAIDCRWRAISSACAWVWMLCDWRRLRKGWMERLNRSGARGSPCHTPVSIESGAEKVLFTSTRAVQLESEFVMSVMIDRLIRIFLKTLSSQSWDTLSYAFSKSRRQVMPFCSVRTQLDRRRMAMCVLLPFTKPVWWSGK